MCRRLSAVILTLPLLHCGLPSWHSAAGCVTFTVPLFYCTSLSPGSVLQAVIQTVSLQHRGSFYQCLYAADCAPHLHPNLVVYLSLLSTIFILLPHCFFFSPRHFAARSATVTCTVPAPALYHSFAMVPSPGSFVLQVMRWYHLHCFTPALWRLPLKEAAHFHLCCLTIFLFCCTLFKYCSVLQCIFFYSNQFSFIIFADLN